MREYITSNLVNTKYSSKSLLLRGLDSKRITHFSMSHHQRSHYATTTLLFLSQGGKIKRNNVSCIYFYISGENSSKHLKSKKKTRTPTLFI